MISVVCWKWKGTRSYKSEYVNALRQMVADNYVDPHRFVCVTDDPAGLDPRIGVVPLPEFEHLPVKQGSPSCYVRLWAFSKEARKHLGERIVSLDVDVVITGDLRPLFNRTEDFIAWSDPTGPQFKYQGGFYVMTTGSRSFVWESFRGLESQAITQAAGLNGTDQAWMSYVMGDEAVVNKDDGIWKMRDFVSAGQPMARSKIIQMYGVKAPWHPISKARSPALSRIWGTARDQAMAGAVYMNTRNYFDGKRMQEQGEINPRPNRIHIRLGFVQQVLQ